MSPNGRPALRSSLGKRLLPTLIDEIARDDPDRPWASIPKSVDLSEGYRDISFNVFANAINRLAWFLHDKIGRSTTFETFAYIGEADMRYHMMAMAAAKTRHKMLVTSHMNSLAGHLNLFEKTDCNILIRTKLVNIDDIIAARSMRQFVIPDLMDLLADHPIKKYPFDVSFQEVKMDPFLVMHTSGSTGLPKPVIIPHAYIVVVDAFALAYDIPHDRPLLVVNRSCKSEKRVRQYMPTHPFHVMALHAGFAEAVYGNMTYVFGPSDRPQNLETAVEVLRYARCDTAYVTPFLLEDFAKSPDALKTLSNLSDIMYAGGVLSKTAGDTISQATRLIQYYGSTEMGPAVCRHTEPEDWQYLALDSQLNGLDWRSAGADMYEPVIVKRPEVAAYQGIFTTFPEATEWPLGDLYTKHPTKADHWLYQGRTDDMVSFAHGSKYYSLSYESQLGAHPLIESVLMIGAKRLQAALLIDLKDRTVAVHDQDRKVLVEELWPAIAAANRDAPTIAQVAKTHLLFTKPDKPFLRVPGKRTVKRNATLELYKDEIDELYATNGDIAFPMNARLKS